MITVKRTIIFIVAILASLPFIGCKQINDDRIPSYPVRMEFNQQVWELYGVHTYGEYRIFDHYTNTPTGYYNFDPDAYTGYGGVLLVSGYDFESGNYNSPLAYDRACPYEANRNTALLSFDTETLEAYCPNCGSRYDVCEGAGTPVEGPAVERSYGLRRYHVIARSGGGYMVTNN